MGEPPLPDLHPNLPPAPVAAVAARPSVDASQTLDPSMSHRPAKVQPSSTFPARPAQPGHLTVWKRRDGLSFTAVRRPAAKRRVQRSLWPLQQSPQRPRRVCRTGLSSKPTHCPCLSAFWGRHLRARAKMSDFFRFRPSDDFIGTDAL
jgi:hypothetical protein